VNCTAHNPHKTERVTDPFGQQPRWLRGVDLHSTSQLILRNLLILQKAKKTKIAKKAILSYSFPTVSL
jgi:hypothetical protein